jgi:hypothetical protein
VDALDIRTSPLLKLLGVDELGDLATDPLCPDETVIGVPHLLPAGIVGIQAVVVRQQPFGFGPGAILVASEQVP